MPGLNARPCRASKRDRRTVGSAVHTIEAMTVPDRAEAVAILLSLDPPDWLVSHSTAVAEVATFLAHAAEKRGQAVDRSLVEAAALLHDVDKTPPLAEMRQALGHGTAGGAWLTARGHEELAAAVANHPATRLSEDNARTWLGTATTEELIVAYADKRAMDDIVPMSERFDAWRRRHPERADFLAAGHDRALVLERRVCALAGVAPTEVSRLAWVQA